MKDHVYHHNDTLTHLCKDRASFSVTSLSKRLYTEGKREVCCREFGSKMRKEVRISKWNSSILSKGRIRATNLEEERVHQSYCTLANLLLPSHGNACSVLTVRVLGHMIC